MGKWCWSASEYVRRDHGRPSPHIARAAASLGRGGQLQSVSTNYLKGDDDDDEKEEEKETGAKCDYRNVEHEMIETSERRTSDGCDSFPRSGVDWRVACISEREEGVSGVCTYYMRDGRTRYTKLGSSRPHVVGLGRTKRTRQHILCTSKSKRNEGDRCCMRRRLLTAPLLNFVAPLIG